MFIDINVRGNAKRNLEGIQFATSKADAETKRFKQSVADADKIIQRYDNTIKKLTQSNSRLKSSQISLKREVEASNRALQSQIDKIKSTKKPLSDYEKAIKNITKRLSFIAVAYKTAEIASRVFIQSLKDFSDLEEKTLEIAKTTGLAGDKLDELTESLNHTASTVRGMKLDNLYEISAVAGQLGVKGKENILKFTTEIQKLVKTSKLTAEEASEGFAKLSNSLNEPIQNIDKLASTFTILASNTTANERVLLDYTQRLAGSGKLLGLTTAQIAGIGATLQDVGITAEVGGTAISDVFRKLITKGDEFAKRLGIDMKTFTDSVNNEPIKAVELFIESLGRMDKKARTQALNDLKLSGSGLSSTLLKLSTNTKKLSANLAIADRGYQSANEHTKEFEIATKGLATTQQQFRDQLKLTSATIGKIFAPMVDRAYRSVTRLLASIDRALSFDLEKATKSMHEQQAQAKITAQINKQKDLMNTIAQSKKEINKILAGSLKGKVSDDNINKILASHGQAYNKAKIELEALNKTIKKIPKKKTIKIKVETEKSKVSSLSNPNPKATTAKSPWVTPIIPQSKEAKQAQREVASEAKRVERVRVREAKQAELEIARIKKQHNREIERQAREATREAKRVEEEKSRIAKRIANEITRVAEQQEIEAQQLEEKRLYALEQFQKQYDSTILTTVEYNFKKINKQKEEFLEIGADSLQIQEWYAAKSKEILLDEEKRISQIKEEDKRKKKYLEDEAKLKKKRDEDARKRATRLIDEFVDTLKDSLINIGKGILDDIGKGEGVVGSVNNNIDNGQMSDALVNSGNPYAVGLGAWGKMWSGALTSSIELIVNKGANNKGFENSLNILSNINNKSLEFNKQIADNTKAMVAGFNNIGKKGFSSKGLTGSEFVPKVDTLFGGGDNIIAGLGSALSHTTKELLNSGIRFQEVLAGNADEIMANGFQRIKTSTSSMFGLINSSKERLTDTGAINEDLRSLVGEVLTSGVNNIVASANELGITGAEELIKSININLGNIDIKGKSEEEIADLFQGVISNALDNVTEESLGSTIEPFRQAGEDYYSTLIRISTGFTDATETLRRNGIKAIDSIGDIGDKTGDVYAETIKDSLLATLGREIETITIDIPSASYNWVTTEYKRVVDDQLTGIGQIIKAYEGSGDELLKVYNQLKDAQTVLRDIRSNGMNEQINQSLINSFTGIEELGSLQTNFYDNFISDVEKQKNLKEKLDRLIGEGLPETKEGYVKLIQSVNLDTQIGRDRYALLLREQNDFLY